MKEQEWKALREQKLNDLSCRFRNAMVNLAMTCKSGDRVRQVMENVIYFVEDYAKFLDENIVEEEINEPEPERHGGRDGVRDRGYTHCEADGELEGTTAGSGTSKGDEGTETKGHQERNGSA
jgi:hypothetical protein